MKSRILITTTVPETLATILYDQPKFLNQHFEVFLATSDGPLFDLLVKEGVQVFKLPIRRNINIFIDCLAVLYYVRIIRLVRPDIVQSFTPKAGLLSMISAWYCRVPVRVHTFTGLVWETKNGYSRALLIWLDRVLCLCATHVVPEGLGVKRLLERFHVTAKPLQLIGNGNIAGVDTNYFNPAANGLVHAATDIRDRFGINADEFVFAFVARLSSEKGVNELLEAFNRLPECCHLLVVGDVDKRDPINCSHFLHIKTNPRIHYMGFLQDIRPALQAADVFVLPSYREGFPNALLQAGAMGLPAIVSDIGGCNEIIMQGQNGWLVPKRNSDELAKAMLFALEIPKVRLDAIGQAARVRIKELFERRYYWENLLTHYKELLASVHDSPIVRKFLLISGYAGSILSFRGDLLHAIQASGYEIHIAVPILTQRDLVFEKKFELFGWRVHHTKMNRVGTNVLSDISYFLRIWFLIRRLSPNCTFSYTIKPVIYGTFAAWLANVPRNFGMITGLGYTFLHFSNHFLLHLVVKRLYKISIDRSSKIFFQNADDRLLFKQINLLSPSTRSCVVNGSGVNLDFFSLKKLPNSGFRFLMIGRLLGGKGVREYVKSATIIKVMYPQVQFALAGWVDANPDAINKSELDAWVKAGVIDYLGVLEDVRSAIAECNVFVLPSYREGTPRAVLEAMAIGRAIITTDAPGCRETVIDGENGFLVSVKSVDELVAAMERFVKQPEMAIAMGMRSRKIAEEKYDVHKVNAVMIRELGL